MVAKGIVESASLESQASVGEVKPWSFTVHNQGGEGIFGGAIQNTSGPASVIIRWGGEETELPVSQDQAYIIYPTGPKPNCTRFPTNGEIIYKVAGTYKIRVLGIHQDITWYYDDYRDFTVTVLSPSLWQKLMAWWNGLATWQKTGLIVAPVGAVTAVIVVKKK